MSWLKRLGAKVWAAIVGLVLLIAVGAGLAVRHRRIQAADIRDRRKVQEGLGRIRELNGRRDELATQADARVEDIQLIDQELNIARAALAAEYQGAEDLTHAEIEAEFARLGF